MSKLSATINFTINFNSRQIDRADIQNGRERSTELQIILKNMVKQEPQETTSTGMGRRTKQLRPERHICELCERYELMVESLSR